MNVGQIKAFMGDQKAEQKASVHPNEALKKQLQQDGLQQAAEFSKQQAASVSVSSSQTSIGLRVVSSSLNQTLEIDGQKPQESKDKAIEEKSTSLFDFEKVARNVLKFVGGVIRGAANGGASDEKLTGLFSQAREGVSRGFAMAEKDLAGFMNDEIQQGMTKSRDLIDTGIDDLETDIFGRNEATAVSLTSLEAVSASDEKSGSLLIRTKDGDEVTFSFESLRSFQASQQLSFTAQNSGTQNASDDNGAETSSDSQSFTAEQTTSYQYYERSGISFSLKGELDEDELQSVADLVGQVQDLADTFYSGDIDKAFEEALSLGFDDKELVGYALQLNRTTQTEVLKTYENIQHYNDEKSDKSQFGNVVSPISQYLDKMMSTFSNVESTLSSNEDYNTLIAGLISKMEDVQVPDLVSAINRFHTFNQTLLQGLPQSTETTANS
ncbi:hypothetical protein KUC3_32620 [Alteromonas sp. KC3]|uniref:DUF5610 domain-containing protein n=1 Tax=unclassified Alteromonas TaxID=2614992 RepID=UPI00192258CD|nr:MULTISPECIES: DUF5610 domain-containing protein [unclassified Alteromonas]BCO20405.1 hypothetical protein KUC3_32620 [Alteromonas sp. KC3]BCO24371.1 hypothetical protein KUC14_32400 [Alteromonas sp. KC14]